MKTCTNCGETKPLKEFQKRARNPDGHTNLCKPCKRAYDNNHYKSNPERKQYIRDNSDARIAKVRAWILAYLKSHPCINCGETDPVVLEFDHRGDKHQAVSTLVRSGGLMKVQEEVAKCDVRCANCHRRKTARDFGFWKLMDVV